MGAGRNLGCGKTLRPIAYVEVNVVRQNGITEIGAEFFPHGNPFRFGAQAMFFAVAGDNAPIGYTIRERRIGFIARDCAENAIAVHTLINSRG